MNPLLIVAGAGALLGLAGGVYGVIERDNYVSEKAARVNDRLAAMKAVNDARASDAIATRALEEAHARVLADLQSRLNARNIAIASTESTNVCKNTPAFRTLFDGLRVGGGPAGAGQAGRPGGAGPRVPERPLSPN